jgi:hypothetical protein
MDGSSVIFIVMPIVIPLVIFAGHRPAVSRAEIAGRAVTCDLPRGHPGPHLHVETGWQY